MQNIFCQSSSFGAVGHLTMDFMYNYMTKHRTLFGLILFVALAIEKSKSQDNFYFDPHPSGKNVIEGSDTRLRCDVSNRKSIKFYWTFKNRQLSNTSRKYQDGGDLVILNANMRNDAGSYRCVATNSTTGVSLRSTEAILSIIWIDKSLDVKLQAPSSKDEVNEGTDLSLSCKANGNPEPEIKWFRNSIRLSNTSKLLIYKDKLQIKSITSADNGVFSCTAENAGGELESTNDFMLNIPGGNAAHLKESTFTRRLLVQKNGRAQFNCEYEGASITEWYFGGRRLSNGPKARIKVFPNGTLLISQVRARDAGLYKCMGLSSNGPAQTFPAKLVLAYLHDFNPDSIQPRQDPSKPNIVPVTKRFQVKCTIPAGLPTPTQRWEDPKGNPIGTTGEVTAVNGVLTITIAQKRHSGNYACVASNIAGVKKRNVSVIVSVPPTIIRGPRPNIPVEEGELAVLQCNVYGTAYPVTQITWVKEGTPIDKNHPRFSPNPELGTLRISNIHVSDAGNYACRVNTSGHNIVTSGFGRLQVLKKLKFLPRPVDTKLELGSRAKIHCRAEGQTSVKVSWHKEKGFLPHIHDRDGTLEFDKVMLSDKGYYTCKASSPTQGHLNATIYVDVVVKPRFKVRPVNTTAYEGYPVILHCQAMGDPKPTIQWDRNGQINAFSTDRFQKKANGSLVITEVYMMDMGRYGCTAGNSGGFERAEIFLTVKSADKFMHDNYKPDSDEDEGFNMKKTILIAVCSAVAYLGIVIGLTVYCSIRLVAAKNRRKALEAQYEQDKVENGNLSRSPEQQPMIDKKDRDSCVKSDDTRSHVSGVSSHQSHSSHSHNSRRRSYDKFQFPRHDLQTLGMLGKGYFGDVFLAKAHGIRDGESETLVVVKSLLSRDEHLYYEYRRELDIFSQLTHENISKLLGVCRDVEPHFMILEYCDWGDLKQFLWATRKDNGRNVNLPPLTTAQKISMCNQVALGLEHLASNRFIHKDIAARNVLLSSSLDVKVSLLGLCRDVYAAEYFHFHQQMIPLRWMAPEAVLEDEFSTKSDVWSYGVFVWEVFALGELPHRSRTNEEVLKGLKAGEMRPDPIASSPEEISHLMNRCWQDSPKDRPTFTDIVSIFNEMTVDSDV